MELLPPIVAGDDYLLTFTFRDANKVPIPQTGNSVRIMVKLRISDADAAAAVNRVVNASAPDAAAGIIRTPLTNAETLALWTAGAELVHVQAQHIVGAVKRSPLLVVLPVLRAVIAGV